MTTATMNPRTGGFLLSELPGSMSRDVVTIASGAGALVAGTILGKITKTGTASAAAFAANTGNGAMGAITVSAGAVAGAYKLVVVDEATNAGAFVVHNPSGAVVGTGNVAAAFSAGGLAFTLADGSTDFVAGDGFTITVAAGSGKYKAYDDDNTDGSEVAAGVLWEAVDATSADVSAVMIARYAEVNSNTITWASTNDAGDKTAGVADLATLGIFVRT